MQRSRLVFGRYPVQIWARVPDIQGGFHVYLATGWAVRGSNPGGGEIFRIRPDRPWGLPSLLYNGYRVFPGGKADGAWCWPPTPNWRRGQEWVELYLYFPFGPSWPVIGKTLLFSCLSPVLPDKSWNSTSNRPALLHSKSFIADPTIWSRKPVASGSCWQRRKMSHIKGSA
jgi:hypothetical protein